MLNYVFEMKIAIDELSEGNPELNIIIFGREHNRIVDDNFAELHKLIDLNSLIVVVVKNQANFSDILGIPDLLSVEEK